jgi:hypothetical protein
LEVMSEREKGLMRSTMPWVAYRVNASFYSSSFFWVYS